ncbi:hypothetical protein MATL_G00109660 [Megalops atlanticus]|uniref:E3 ubiquitin/ISG15 ligase TRIM25-like n=1 Tax=Megalops atlanticus TaxID=7932 RepID=A0A9D3Q0M9_MEGAT|nr:hypothetical protein MATL_G00109660 [Megalops atlanticus]
MAHSAFLDQEQFNCSVCLDLLKDPVTINCGHSYCMDCIKDCWDQDDNTGVYSCPQCRQTFSPRPVLGKNTMLADVVEKLKKTGLQTDPPAQCYAGPGDIACDVCAGRKHKAVRACLVCLASYCETHLQPHHESSALQRHKLINATGELREKICPQHDKLLEAYCRTDQQCICLLCMIDEHRDHVTLSAAKERTEKQKLQEASQKEYQQSIQEREKELKDLRESLESLTRSAQAAVEASEKIFTDLIHAIERRRSEVKEMIRDQEKTVAGRAEEHLVSLEQEIAELKRRDAALEQLSRTEDHIHFLQNCQSLFFCADSRSLPCMTVNPSTLFGDVSKAISQLKQRVESVCQEEFIKISRTVKDVCLLPAPEPMSGLVSSEAQAESESVSRKPAGLFGQEQSSHWPAGGSQQSRVKPFPCFSSTPSSAPGFIFSQPPTFHPGPAETASSIYRPIAGRKIKTVVRRRK